MGKRRRGKWLPSEPVVLEIDNLSHEGRGIAHLDGKVIFVDEALPGEVVEAVYTGRGGAYDEARTRQVLDASPDRVQPPCAYASICGGCSLQHFDSRAQLRFKARVLHEKLQHSLGRDDYRKLDPVTGPTLHYRRKARLGVRYVARKEETLVGFREKGSNFITRMDSCEVLHPAVSEILPALKQVIGELDSYRHIPQIEVAVGDEYPGRNPLALVFRHLRALSEEDRRRLIELAREKDFDLYLQGGGVDSIELLSPAQAEDRLYYQLPDHGFWMAFHPMDFTQVNADINRRMIDRALGLLELDDTDSVLDFFCGLGNFTLPMAGQCRHVTGVEGSEALVGRGRENASRNRVNNVTFARADLDAPVTTQPWLSRDITKALLDPPRSGALNILADVAACRPEKILYISCNPATLARDGAKLETLGFRLQGAGVLDMFPQTSHVESMALFEAA